MPDRPGAVYVQLRMKCPACQGILEKETGTERELIRCRNCELQWAGLKALLAAKVVAEKSRFKIPTLDQVKTALQIGKIGVRGARNVAGRGRAVSDYVKDIIADVADFDSESVKRVGQGVEAIVDQLILAVEDVQDARSGKLGEEPEDEKPGEPE